MKRIIALLLMVMMALTLLAGCGDPVLDELENYVNVEITPVNENYKKIAEEIAAWGQIEDDSALEASLKNELIPLVDETILILEKIPLKTDEVMNLNAKYIKAMMAHKEGFALLIDGIQKKDASIMYKGNDKINEGIDILADFNTSLTALTKELSGENQ